MGAKKYKSTIVSIQNPLPGIYTVELKALKGRFRYAPGQFLHLAIDKEYDGIGQWPDSRCFSMQSNPGEKNIRITYAVKGEYTQLMEKSMEEGSEVWLKLPYGNLFTQPHNKTNTVFIAGGTGITPFLSLFTDTFFTNYINPRVYLGFKTKEHNIYQNDLKKINCNYSAIYENEEGVLNIEQIRKENSKESSYFISGPPDMIKIFKRYLTQNEIPESHVLTDDWE